MKENEEKEILPEQETLIVNKEKEQEELSNDTTIQETLSIENDTAVDITGQTTCQETLDIDGQNANFTDQTLIDPAIKTSAGQETIIGESTITPIETLAKLKSQNPELSGDITLCQKAIEKNLVDLESIKSCIESHEQTDKNSSLLETIISQNMLSKEEVESLKSELATLAPEAPTSRMHSRERIEVGKYFGEYFIEKQLGRGGMGVVYKAIDKNLGRTVAIKLIISTGKKKETRRFMQEAKVTAQLEHPNIVRLFEVNEYQGYFIMEYIDGQTLDDFLKIHPLSPKELATVFHKIAKALAFAHRKGIIHRDIKPSNIMIDSSHEPKIMDFGLAKFVDAQIQLSNPGDLLGTPAYMPPEQAEGEMVDFRCDIYSLGATMYDVLTQRPPFQGASYVNILNQVLREDPLQPRTLNPDIPRDLEAICLKCIEKSAFRRYQETELLAQDLDNFIQNKPTIARPPSPFDAVRKFIARNKAICSLVASFTLVCIVGVLLYILAIQNERDKTLFAKEQEKKQRKRAEANATLAEKKQKYAEKQQDLAEKRWKYAQEQRKIANKKTKEAEWQRQRAEKNEERAKREQKKAEKEKREKEQEARLANIRLSKISFAKAIEAWKLHGKIREAGVLSAVALEFLKEYNGDEMRRLRKKYTKLLLLSLLKYGLIWKKDAQVIRSPITHIAFNYQSRILACAHEDNKIVLWNALSGKYISTIKGKSKIHWLSFDPKGKMLACASNGIQIYTIRTGKLLRFFRGYSSRVNSIDFRYDGKYIVSASNDKTVRIWDVAKGRSVRIFKGHRDFITTAFFSKNGKYIISGSTDLTVRLWNVKTGQEEKLFFGTKAVFSPSGEYIAAANHKRSINIWSIKSHRRIKTLEGHKSVVTALVFSPDGKILATACGGKYSKDFNVRLWDIGSGKVKRVIPHSSGVTSLAFAPDGHTIATVSYNNILSLWEISQKRFYKSKPVPYWAKKYIKKSFPGDIGWIKHGIQYYPQKIMENFFELSVTEILSIKPLRK